MEGTRGVRLPHLRVKHERKSLKVGGTSLQEELRQRNFSASSSWFKRERRNF